MRASFVIAGLLLLATGTLLLFLAFDDPYGNTTVGVVFGVIFAAPGAFLIHRGARTNLPSDAAERIQRKMLLGRAALGLGLSAAAIVLFPVSLALIPNPKVIVVPAVLLAYGLLRTVRAFAFVCRRCSHPLEPFTLKTPLETGPRVKAALTQPDGLLELFSLGHVTKGHNFVDEKRPMHQKIELEHCTACQDVLRVEHNGTSIWLTGARASAIGRHLT